jgi:hypothetical protein
MEKFLEAIMSKKNNQIASNDNFNELLLYTTPNCRMIQHVQKLHILPQKGKNIRLNYTIWTQSFGAAADSSLSRSWHE